jgi:hypothetical protein
MPSEAYLKKTYGLSLNDYNKMVVEQHGLCKICHRKPKRLVVDHNHKTGKIRGLLGDDCNMDLGYYEYMRETMEKYLKENDG